MITTHVLDTATGRAAAGVPVTLLSREAAGAWRQLGAGVTGADGRLGGLVPDGARLAAGAYRLVFDTGAWFASRGLSGLYPEVVVVFEVRDPATHYHLPLLLSPFGYTTYRGG